MADDDDIPSWSDDDEDVDEEDEEEMVVDCYISDQESSVEEEDCYLLGLEDGDGNEEDSRWSVSSVITKESLLAAQNEDIGKVMELLGLKEQHARTLLIYYRWDVERIFELLDQKGRDLLFSEAGVAVIDDGGLISSRSISMVTCNVCFENLHPTLMTEMDCGHPYCNECWTEYFIVMINDGQSRCIRCMAPKCNSICDEAVVRNLVSARDSNVAARFDRFLLESYIEDNNKVKWCPSLPHCGNAIRVEGDIVCEVQCTCGIQFCFSCLLEPHSPCSCLMWELWTKKCQDESETVNWMTANTKSCPKCHKSVEKNGGCNLVSCICGQAFCWLCGGATGRDHTWATIRGHSCGRFKEEESKKADRARRDLKRYMHYYNRYKAHKDSLKQESNLKEKVQGKISISMKKESKIKDYSWVTSGLNRLFRSRRILSYSYPFAFYMFGDELFKDEMTPKDRELKQNLFEDQQQQLECNVERLSMFLEKDFHHYSDDEVMQTMGHVINLSSVVDKLCNQMYQCIENDLLYPLQHATHNIAPYKSKGLKKASELSVLSESEQSLASIKINDKRFLQSDSTLSGNGATMLGKLTGLQVCSSSNSDDSGCSSRKRARKDSNIGVALFDLNMPAKLINKI